MTAVKKAAATATQKADGVLDSLAVTGLEKVLNLLPVRYKTLAGTVIVSLAAIANEAFATFSLFQDTQTDELIINIAYIAGSSLAGIGIIHKNRKAQPPTQPQPMTPIGGN